MLLLIEVQFARKLLGKWHPAESNNLTGNRCAHSILENSYLKMIIMAFVSVLKGGQ